MSVLLPMKNLYSIFLVQKPETELERLRRENQELKTELALLKKVKALVEEREARLRAIGRGQSEN